VTDCVEIGLWRALDIWSSGVKLDEYCIVGHSTVFWGRLAKCIALAASATILLDILGEQRIHAVTGKLGSWLRIGVRPFDSFWSKSQSDHEVDWEVLTPFWKIVSNIYFLVVMFAVAVGLALFMLGNLADTISPGILDRHPAVTSKLDWVLVTAFVLGVSPFAISSALKSAAYVLGNPVLCWYARCLAATALLVSWGLDMLASS